MAAWSAHGELLDRLDSPWRKRTCDCSGGDKAGIWAKRQVEIESGISITFPFICHLWEWECWHAQQLLYLAADQKDRWSWVVGQAEDEWGARYDAGYYAVQQRTDVEQLYRNDGLESFRLLETEFDDNQGAMAWCKPDKPSTGREDDEERKQSDNQ